MRQVEGPCRASCQLKKAFKVLRRRQGSCWEELQRIENSVSRQGVIYLSPRQINDYSPIWPPLKFDSWLPPEINDPSQRGKASWQEQPQRQLPDSVVVFFVKETTLLTMILNCKKLIGWNLVNDQTWT